VSTAAKIVFLKNTFPVRIFFLNRTTITIEGKRTIWHYWGKIFLVRSFVLRESTHPFQIFLLNRPLTYFWGKTDRLVRFGEKLFRTKTSLHFASFAPKIVFLKNTFPVRIFLLNRTTTTIGAKRTIWHDSGKNCSGAKFCVFEKARLCSEFFY
jgi:hypothetical protein